MGLKKTVASIMGAVMVTAVLGASLNVFADVEDSDEAFQSVNAQTSAEYVADDDIATLSEGTVQIHYDVPLFRQNDTSSSWCYATINGSSDTMNKYGCLITDFAMVRSYELGTYVYPNEMMQPYSNDTGVGVVFSRWGDSSMMIPSSAKNYGWSVYGKGVDATTGEYEIPNDQTNSQQLLGLLYTKLQNGPVILGGYKRAGQRSSENHWVVVTGYTGNGQTFSASDFTINDPGITNNYTLADFQATYQFWDRIVYKDAVTTNTTTYTTATQSLKGDMNADGVVNTADLLIFRKYVLDMVEISNDILSNNDLDDDGEVNVKDYLTLKIMLYWH
jgi:hypothetical protein